MSSRLKDRKNKLREESDKFEESLSGEFDEISEKAFDIGKKALIIGGGALISFLIVRAIVGKSSKETDKESELQERIIVKSSPKNVFLKSLSDKASLVLLELARELIISTVKKMPEEDAEKDI